MASIRSPICTVLGHVDHGKSSILDKIRGTAIVASEAGAITQAIGASIIPLDVIKHICGELLQRLNMKFTIPGLLFIDTPGHEAFTNLRKRGGSLADIAVLVVDINEGFKPQTEEAVEILKASKTPFVVAANKVDLVQGWNHVKEKDIVKKINALPEKTREEVEKKLYEIVGKLYELGFNSERFDRVKDFTRQVAIIPTSAKTGEGLPELLMVMTGLAQRFLEECLECSVEGGAKGTILEVKEEKGLGTTLDVIIYDGSLKVNDTLVIGGVEAPIVTKVRALFEPMPLAEMRDKKSRFRSVKEVHAATGVKISAPGIDNAVAGMPLAVANNNVEQVKAMIQKEVEEVLIETDKEGIVVKADALGSLEALVRLLKDRGVKIKRASVGNITKKDITDAEANFEKNPLQSVVLGFNVKDESGLCNDAVKVITSDVIYKVIEDFEKWVEEETKRIEAKELDVLVRPCKIELLRGYVFRQSNPAIVGVEVLEGVLKTGTPLMKDGRKLTVVKEIQQEKENIAQAEKGKQVAVSLDNVTLGRQIQEGDVLYSAIPEEDFRRLKKLKKYLSPGEIEAVKEIAAIMRKDNPVWGV